MLPYIVYPQDLRLSNLLSVRKKLDPNLLRDFNQNLIRNPHLSHKNIYAARHMVHSLRFYRLTEFHIIGRGDPCRVFIAFHAGFGQRIHVRFNNDHGFFIRARLLLGNGKGEFLAVDIADYACHILYGLGLVSVKPYQNAADGQSLRDRVLYDHVVQIGSAVVLHHNGVVDSACSVPIDHSGLRTCACLRIGGFGDAHLYILQTHIGAAQHLLFIVASVGAVRKLKNGAVDGAAVLINGGRLHCDYGLHRLFRSKNKLVSGRIF